MTSERIKTRLEKLENKIPSEDDVSRIEIYDVSTNELVDTIRIPQASGVVIGIPHNNRDDLKKLHSSNTDEKTIKGGEKK